jgi:VanZ family protein
VVERTLRIGFQAGFWIPFAACTWLALTPSPPEAVFRLSDVLLHIVAFAYLTFMLCLAYPAAPAHGPARRWILPALAMLGYGLLLEALQGAVFSRHASVGDMGTDLIGIVLGLACYRLLGGWMRDFTAGALTRVFGDGR